MMHSPLPTTRSLPQAARQLLDWNRGPAHQAQAPLAAQSTCIWCPRSFRPRTTGGSRQRFCCPRCREGFFAAARAWALLALERGLVTAEVFRAAQASMHAVAGPIQTPAPPLPPV